MVIVSVGHMLKNSGDVLEVPCLCCDDAENMRSSCVCGYLRGVDSCSPDCSTGALNLLAVSACVYRFLSFEGAENTCSSCVCGFLHGEDSSSQDCSIAALNLLAVVACVYRFQPFVMCFQPFVLLALCVGSSSSRRQRTCVKGMGKDCKGEKELICFQARKIEAQASSLIQAESLIALESAELEERQAIDISWDDVRNAVVAECPEYQFEAAAAFGTCRSQPEKLEAVQSGQNIQFFIKGVRGSQTQVVRGGSHVALSLVASVIGTDVYAMVGGRIVDHSLSLESLGITSEVHCVLLLTASWWVS